LTNLPSNSKLIICKDSYGNNKLLENYHKKYITYSLIDDTADYKAVDIFLAKNYSRFKVKHEGKILGEFTIPLAGLHYISNSLASIILSLEIGIDIDTIKKALSNYKGVKRRFEIIANFNDTMIVDDYAHHPTEIKATLSSASLYNKYLTVVFQPHRYSRTKSLLNDFVSSFDLADRIIITDIYSAGELYEDYQINSENLYKLIKLNYPNKEVYYIKELDEVKDFILNKYIPNHLIITMGAGTITNLSKSLVKEMTSFQKI
jgi:UDP-N-acetylmuramate--alanine ligase